MSGTDSYVWQYTLLKYLWYHFLFDASSFSGFARLLFTSATKISTSPSICYPYFYIKFEPLVHSTSSATQLCIDVDLFIPNTSKDNTVYMNIWDPFTNMDKL